MKQIILAQRYFAALPVAGYYCGFTQFEPVAQSSEASACIPWSCAGTFRNFGVTATAAISAGKTVVLTIRKNGADTDLSITLTEGQTTGSDTTHEVTVAAGDYLSLHGSCAQVETSRTFDLNIEFEGTVENQSGYATAPTTMSTSAARYMGLFESTGWTATQGNRANLVATSGHVTRLDVRCHDKVAQYSPGSGFDFAIVLNGVLQDGTGGTVNTTVSLRTNDVAGSSTFSLAVAAGDRLEVYSMKSGTPSPTWAGVAADFVADTDGEYLGFGGSSYDTLNAGTAETNWACAGPHNASWSNSATGFQRLGGLTDVTVGKLRVWLSAAPGAGGSGDTYTFTLRKNGTDDAGDPSAAVVETATTAADSTRALLITGSDYFHVRCTPSNTPATTLWALWGMVFSVDMEPVWVPVADYVEQEIPSSAFPGGAARVLGELWTEALGSPGPVVKARLYNLTDSVSVGESAEIQSDEPADCDFAVTLASGTKRYRLEVTSEPPGVDLFFSGRGVGP